MRNGGVLAALLGLGLLASCSDDGGSPGPGPSTGGASTAAGGSSSGGAATGGSGGAAPATGGSSDSGGSGGAVAAGGSGGSDTGGAPSGGAAGEGLGGGSGAAGDSSGGSGGGANNGVVAVAQIAAVDNSAIAGTATFTQVGDTVTLVIELTGCPPGVHASHLHENKSCGGAGNAAGGHWSPNGEDLGNYTCTAEGTVRHEVSRPTTVWTVGDAGVNDVTQFSFIVHAAGDPNAGARIACGLIDAQ
jgi:Cu/Zn superoxide dismutase